MPNELTGLFTDRLPGKVRSYLWTFEPGDSMYSLLPFVWEYFYDTSGRLFSDKMHSGRGGGNEYYYDSTGMLINQDVWSCMPYKMSYQYTIDQVNNKMLVKIVTNEPDSFFRTYKYDSVGRVLSQMSMGWSGHYETYKYSGNKLTFIKRLFDRRYGAQDDTLESSYEAQRIVVYYYTSERLDSTITNCTYRERRNSSYKLTTIYNEKGLPDSSFINDKAVGWYSYTYY